MSNSWIYEFHIILLELWNEINAKKIIIVKDAIYLAAKRKPERVMINNELLGELSAYKSVHKESFHFKKKY